jgi:hypothetical protein
MSYKYAPGAGEDKAAAFKRAVFANANRGDNLVALNIDDRSNLTNPSYLFGHHNPYNLNDQFSFLGGENVATGALIGALIGGQVGFAALPKDLVNGLALSQRPQLDKEVEAFLDSSPILASL